MCRGDIAMCAGHTRGRFGSGSLQPMRRGIFEDEHKAFRETVRRFVAEEIAPHHERWEQDGIVPRELFGRAAAVGMLAMGVAEQYGGLGLDDFRFNQVINEEVYAAGVAGSGMGIVTHNDICMPYFLACCNEQQRARWLPGLADGRLIAALAMTEPDTGSDLAAIATSAVRDGDHFVVNGAKTFISNGINADLIIVAVKTDPAAKHRGISLLVVERGMEGFERGRNLDKLGLHAQDTAELFFTDVRVPVANLLGEEGKGFGYMMESLARERLTVAISSVAAARGVLEHALQYVRERTAFGQPIGSFQHNRFVLAEIESELQIATTFCDQAVLALNAGELTAEDAAMAKWWCTELQGRVVDRCLQLHGGYGYMLEYPIARAYADARITRIYAGTTEIMKEIIGRSMGL